MGVPVSDAQTIDTAATQRVADPGLIQYTHIIYALHALAVLIGVFGFATIVGNFVFGLPSIVAVVMNYIRRHEARGTWLESHFSWQIRTFWIAFEIIVAAAMMSLPLLLFFGLGILTYHIAAGLAGIWVVYRVAKGWLNLRDDKPVA